MLRNKPLLLLSLLLFSLAAFSQDTYLIGRITGEANQDIQLVYNKIPFMRKPLELRTKTDSTGKFFLNFPLDKPAAIDFVHGGKSITLILAPQDSVYMRIYKEGEDYAYEFSGRGFEESYLNYLNYRDFDKEVIKTFNQTLTTSDPASYEKQVKEWMKTFREVQGKNLKTLKAGSDLKKLAGKMELVKEANYYLIYINYYRSQATGQYIPAESFRKFVSQPELFKIDHTPNPEYQNFLLLHLTNMGPEPQENTCKGIVSFLEFTDSVYAHKSKAELLGRILWEGMDNNCFKEIKDWYESYLNWTPYPDYAQALRSKAATLSSLSPGDDAPDFEFVDKDGNTHTLAELRGKVIYLDFWATWCGPCIQSMKLSGPLKEKFKDNPNVAFVYISTDQNQAKWQGHYITNNGEPNMWHLGNSAYAASSAYRITTIPRYVIIDKNGKIVDPNAPRPYSPEIEQILIREAAKPYVKPNE